MRKQGIPTQTFSVHKTALSSKIPNRLVASVSQSTSKLDKMKEYLFSLRLSSSNKIVLTICTDELLGWERVAAVLVVPIHTHSVKYMA